MLLYLGPVIFGFLIGFILGSRIKNTPTSNIKFTVGSYVVIFIVAIIVAWQLGPFPYYTDLPIASGFLSAAIGLITGKLIFGRYSI
ncbi:hypothetical protein MBCUT_13690 [Methanobrevibacter cuticularis]|uniref:Energy-converting hydrogenase B subunit J n=1 Tax=Methanobrevibacter cuticularis TaxID=47311 RepID=A0A166DJS9_9EURY|nr:energy-converting hydrogenase B subunit J [Methanobrevibacter cuticularis]KZX15671.1 hypothetical protein MBCUT_13690 [Methanobrevibacter cuticularis]